MSSPSNLSCSAPLHVCLRDLRGLPQIFPHRPSLHLSGAALSVQPACTTPGFLCYANPVHDSCLSVIGTESAYAACIYNNNRHCCPQLAQPALLCPGPAHSTPGRRSRPRHRPPRAAASGGAWAAASPGAASECNHLTSPLHDVQRAAQCLCFCKRTRFLCANFLHGLLDS